MTERLVLVTGGTRGIGKAIGLAFARLGDRVVLTHRWGSVDPEDLRAEFGAAGAALPEIIEADVAFDDDTDALLDQLGQVPDVFVANVCVAGRGDGQLHARTLTQSLAASAYPLREYLDRMAARFDAWPTYVLATSSDGHLNFYPGYDYVAASKALLEATITDLGQRHHGTCFAAIRARQVDTTSFRDMFGEDVDVIARFDDFHLEPAEVASAAVALCSGDLDAFSGGVLVVDRGASDLDNLVNVAPRLLGSRAAWEDVSHEVGRPDGVLYVDAGLALDPDVWPDATMVPLSEVGALDPSCIPNTVVVGHDWRVDGVLPPARRAAVLVDLMEGAAQSGSAPRYGVQIDIGDDPHVALSNSLGRYYNGWRLLSGSRINFVRGGDVAALRAARSLTSGALDAVRGQTLRLRSR